MNTANTRGRKPFKISWPTGAFSVEQLFERNRKDTGKGPIKCELTARNHIQRGLATGKLVKLAKKVETGSVGAPAFLFQLASYAKHNEARRAKKAMAAVESAPVETPEVTKAEQVQ